MGIFADQLIDEIQTSDEWPLRRERPVWDALGDFIALRETDTERLRVMAGWTDRQRRYLADPLAPRVSDAFAGLIWSTQPTIRAAADGDADQLDQLVRENRLLTEPKRQHKTVSSEGEVWWRAVADPDIAPVALVEWYSRLSVIPLYRAQRLVACAFVSAYVMEEDDGKRQRLRVCRHFEVHDRDSISNIVMDGWTDKLGSPTGLDALDETADLDERWDHNLERMLAGRIVNVEGVDPTLGMSDYHGIRDMLIGLDEGLTVGQENMRLVAKKRVTAPAWAVDPDTGELPAGREVITENPSTVNVGKGQDQGDQHAMFKVIEYEFDAGPLIAWTDNLASRALTRVGIMPQFAGIVGGNEGGNALTGTALRTRLIPSDHAANDRAEGWDRGLPAVLQALIVLDALPADDGGMGNQWTDIDAPPTIERAPALPEDLAERAVRLSILVNAGVMSKAQALRELHPEWSDDQLDDELAKIEADHQTDAAAPVPLNGGSRLPAALRLPATE